MGAVDLDRVLSICPVDAELAREGWPMLALGDVTGGVESRGCSSGGAMAQNSVQRSYLEAAQLGSVYEKETSQGENDVGVMEAQFM